MTPDKEYKMEPGECNRCGAAKDNVLGLCGACGRFPKPQNPTRREMEKRMTSKRYTY